ncbi:MAG: hypothetical protein ACYS0F_03795, partial [Planctomycetota bacterium]
MDDEHCEAPIRYDPSGGDHMTGLSGSSVAGLIARARHDSRAADDLLVSYRTYLRFIARDGIGVGLRSKVDASDIAQDIVMRARERSARQPMNRSARSYDPPPKDRSESAL